MIVYNALKYEFDNDVERNEISDKIYNKIRELGLSGGQNSEYMAWQNSLNFMKNVLDDNDIPIDCSIAIEYQIPRTSKRVDFMIAGADQNDKDNIIIIELKQWERAEKIDDIMDHSVRTYTGHAKRDVSHPSYQAYSYAVFIREASEQVSQNDIGIIPCAYLHNYKPEYISELNDNIYRIWYEEAPFFVKNQSLELRNFIKKYINKRSKKW